MPNQVLEISDDVTVTSFLSQSQHNVLFLFVRPRSIFLQILSKIRQETKKLLKMGNDVIVTSFQKISQKFLCESCFYPYLFMYQVSS